MAIRGRGGPISTLKNDPKYKNSCGILFSSKKGGGHISTLKNDPKYKNSCGIIFSVKKGGVIFHTFNIFVQFFSWTSGGVIFQH